MFFPPPGGTGGGCGIHHARKAYPKAIAMIADWSMLSDDLQLMLAREALRKAADTIAGHAEILAEEMECGSLADRGGPDALRLLANLVRVSGEEAMPVAGHA